MKKVIRNILLVLVSILILAFIFLSAFVGRQVFEGYTNATSREETIKSIDDSSEIYKQVIRDNKATRLYIDKENSNKKVPAILVQRDGNKNIAVLVHGMGGTKESMADLMNGFLDIGYDVISYDQRNSGENMEDYNTFGVLESYDTLAVLKYIVPKYRENYKYAKVILWGESYGGLTSIIAAGRDDSLIDYLILDSSVSDGRILLRDVMKGIADDQGIPLDYLMATGDWYTNFGIGVRFKDFNGLTWIKNVSKPVLITNSDKDTLTPPYMAEDIYNAISHEKKEIHIVKGYNHASFPKRDNELYMQIVNDFINKYDMKTGDTDEPSK